MMIMPGPPMGSAGAPVVYRHSRHAGITGAEIRIMRYAGGAATAGLPGRRAFPCPQIPAIRSHLAPQARDSFA
jgi:hypothetical protein